MGHTWTFEKKCLVPRSGQVLLMLATATPALYMESLAGATKGTAKAAGGEAEKKNKKKRKEKEDTKHKACRRNEVLQQRLQQRTGLAGPAMPRPNALARLQQRACAPLLRAGPPLGRLQQRACARQQRACVRLLRATKATRLRVCLGGTQGGARFGGLRWVQRCQWALKWWLGRVLALQGGPD